MNNDRERLARKILYLEDELRELENYFRVEETCSYLRHELDRFLVELKMIEVSEVLSEIDAA